MFHTKFCYSNELFTPSFKTELDPLSSDFLVYCVEYLYTGRKSRTLLLAMPYFYR